MRYFQWGGWGLARMRDADGNRGGLRADVLASGTIALGDRVEPGQ